MLPFSTATVTAANTVVTHRLALMWLNALARDPKRERELDRMVTEKIAASVEATVLAPAALLQGALVFARDCGRGAPMPLAMADALDTTARTLMQPAGRRVHANARRLKHGR